MAEFLEVPVRREDGSKGLQYINIDAISYVEPETDAHEASTGLKVYLNNGYWFTVVGPQAAELLSLIKSCATVQFKKRVGDN